MQRGPMLGAPLATPLLDRLITRLRDCTIPSMHTQRPVRSTFVTVHRTGNLAQVGWGLLTFFAAGLAFTCLIPLAARLTLLNTADDYRPSTLIVEHFTAARQRQGGRIMAHGVLADGQAARVQILREALPLRADGSRDRPQALDTEPATAAVELAVLVNHALDRGWLHRDQVLLAAVDWPARWRQQAMQLLALIAGGLVVAGVAAWRCRRAGRSR